MNFLEPIIQKLDFKIFTLCSIALMLTTSCAWNVAPDDNRTRNPLATPSYHNTSVTAVRQHLQKEMSDHVRVSYSKNGDVLAKGAQTTENKIRLFYSLHIISSENRASGINQNNNDYWNREHIWPTSFGLKRNLARADLHNLVPADRSINSSRQNKFFDESNQPHAECTDCFYDKDSWEPPNSVKGDVARVAFYMDVRYDGRNGAPDLILTDHPDKATGRFGRLSTLLHWHCADPVSEEEIQRHEVAALAQGNRNIFVDEPALVAVVFNFDCPELQAASTE